MKYAVVTFGCRVNQADSLEFEEQLLAAGATPSAPDHADVVIVNTCSVTASADQGARQTIRRIARSNPRARIVVTGCYATRRSEDLAALPGVEQVLRNAEKPRLVNLLQASSQPTTAERFGDGQGSCGASIAPGVAGRTAYTLRVQTGCAEACTYCIIPSTRGAPRSATIADVLRDAERVAASGFKEIALTGVHLGSYGRDLRPAASLGQLLRALDDPSQPHLRMQPDVLFRISSLEPMDCTPEIVDLVATGRSFAPHFHLPLQHASGRILAAMRRPYTIAQYAALVDAIRERIPHASIGSDVIVGFPGEDDGDFEELATYLAGSALTHLHVFPYSDRPGTVAARMEDKVDGAVIRERAARIREISRRLTNRFHASQMGTVHRALTIEDGTVAVTGNYLKVNIPPGRVRNEWVAVKITNGESTLAGELVP